MDLTGGQDGLGEARADVLAVFEESSFVLILFNDYRMGPLFVDVCLVTKCPAIPLASQAQALSTQPKELLDPPFMECEVSDTQDSAHEQLSSCGHA